MPIKDKRVDAYIEKSNDFAKPILKHLRSLVHKACPDVVEVMKWSFPNFEYKGLMCSMAAFKAHCAFGFWKHKLIEDPNGLIEKGEQTGMGVFGKIYSLKDLPSDKILTEYILQAMKLNEDGVKLPPKPRVAAKEDLVFPEKFEMALNKNKKAKAAFEKMSYSHQKEYVQYINEAKREETRESRISKSIEKLAENKSHNWKYEK